MNFIKKILHLMIILLVRKFGMCLRQCSPPCSPCPDIFLYKNEGGQWRGEIKIILSNKNVENITLEAAYYVRPEEDLYTSKLIKKDSKEETLFNFDNGQPITFTLHFSSAEILHWIRHIKLNGEQICTGTNPGLINVVREVINLNFYEILKTRYVKVPINHENTNYLTSTTKRPQMTNRPKPLTIPEESPSDRQFYTVSEGTDKCGIIPDTKAAINLISNGELAIRQPWIVGLFETTERDPTFFCAGTLITTQFVITAAHCTSDRTSILLLLGATDVSKINAPGSIIRTSINFKQHDQYVKGSSNADIAIVKMIEPVAFTSTIQPVCMWPNAYLDENIILNFAAKVYGWGNDENGHPSPQLKTTSLRIKSLRECKEMDLLRDTLSDRTICAASDDFRSGPCRGDSGGGLYISVYNRTTIRGVISSAVGYENQRTCDHTYFSVFTDVGKHFNWIQDIVNKI